MNLAKGAEERGKGGGARIPSVRISQVIYEHSRALRHGQDRVGLDLGVWREYALG